MIPVDRQLRQLTLLPQMHHLYSTTMSIVRCSVNGRDMWVRYPLGDLLNWRDDTTRTKEDLCGRRYSGHRSANLRAW